MKLRTNVGLTAGLFGLVATVFGLVGVPAWAESTTSGIEITPATRSIELDPGENYTSDQNGPFEVQITAHGVAAQVKLQVEPYAFPDTDQASDVDIAAKTALAHWIRLSDSRLDLAADETRPISFTIAVPDDADSGGQYAQITACGGEELDDCHSAVIMARVSGEIRQEARVKSINIRALQIAHNLTATSTIENDGNVEIGVGSKLEVRGLFSDRLIAEVEAPEATVLPGTTQSLDSRWNLEGLPLGVYRVKQVTTILDTEHVGEQIVFVASPWALAIISAFPVLVIIGIFFLLKLRAGWKKDATLKKRKLAAARAAKKPETKKPVAKRKK